MDRLLFGNTTISSAYQQAIAAAWMLVAVAVFHLGVTRHLARARFTLVPGAPAAGAAGWTFYHAEPIQEVVLGLNGALTLMLYAGTAGICLDAWRAARVRPPGRDTWRWPWGWAASRQR
ncbi:hypothetical protein GR925_38425 [Streptomyces sp. HUCO-GS316]|uniref:hypothetical protein n=1 Tax=Streptomyces sp. HUCO-GS316 TaxID=2692198 RepID=UPI0013684261|nr:hypothetical protein [Streptomyces sp. HUCO-GS316]MXM69113.1 hypothetical protein [Streptomyces sp. HUCO-GS316]